MARPTKPKDVKPKALEPVSDPGGGGKQSSSGMNMIVMALVIVLCTTLCTAASILAIYEFYLKGQIASLVPKGEGEEGEEGGEEGGEKLPTIGPVVDLDEFTVNLKETEGGAQHYLRATISLTVTSDDPNFETLEGEALHKWEEGFHMQMAHYVPAIRDICISALTKRTSTELSTLQGKQEFKDEIKRNVDGIFHDRHKVIRVNLENFIIQ
jgi:flagellar basal body-associated protein FliL